MPSAPGALAPVRLMLSGPSSLNAPSAPLAGTSRFHRKAAYTRCFRCAGAPRRPTSGSVLSLSFLLGMPSSSTPGSSVIAPSSTAMPTHGPSPRIERLSAPKCPAIRFTRELVFVALRFTSATACQVARPPVRNLTGSHLGQRGLLRPKFQRVGRPPVVGYDYDGLSGFLLSAGLAPAGMIASFAAPTPTSSAPGLSSCFGPMTPNVRTNLTYCTLFSESPSSPRILLLARTLGWEMRAWLSSRGALYLRAITMSRSTFDSS